MLPDWHAIETAPKDGTTIVATDGKVTRETWFGKTSHVPLYGWCWNDGDPEDTDLWSPQKWWPAVTALVTEKLA